jgi:hypothetical protein
MPAALFERNGLLRMRGGSKRVEVLDADEHAVASDVVGEPGARCVGVAGGSDGSDRAVTGSG